MMTSFINNIPVIVNAVAKEKPKHILDIGSAFGKYGLLIKEALLSLQAEEGNLCPEPNFRITACENAEYFIEQGLLQAIYDDTIFEDIRLATPEWLKEFDFVLLIDVIEHWDKKDFWDLLRKFKKGTKVLISTPKRVSFYKERFYNSDPHITQFEASDFGGIDLSTKDSLIYLITI